MSHARIGATPLRLAGCDDYARVPTARPTLAETALALAAQDGSPLAARPDVIERATAEVIAHRPDATADDVLLWAEAQQEVGG